MASESREWSTFGRPPGSPEGAWGPAGVRHPGNRSDDGPAQGRRQNLGLMRAGTCVHQCRLQSAERLRWPERQSRHTKREGGWPLMSDDENHARLIEIARTALDR